MINDYLSQALATVDKEGKHLNNAFWKICLQSFNFTCRYNARGFDLNRNFPDYFKQNTKREQPETDAVKEWISKIQFVLSGSLHGGALVASYPYDNTPNSSKYQFCFLYYIICHEIISNISQISIKFKSEFFLYMTL